MNKYIDIVINKSSFYIVEHDFKPKTHHLALETLNKIEFAVKNKLSYDSSHKDSYSQLTLLELFNVLKEKSSKICSGYHEKQSKLNWLFQKIFSRQKEVNKIHTRINSYINSFTNPSQVFPVAAVLIKEITTYLEISDLRILAQLNHDGKTQATTAILKRAKELGYQGCNPTEAAKYTDDLFKEISDLTKQRIIPKEYISYKGETLDFERILQNLKKMSTQDIFTILSKEELYSLKFQKFRKIFKPDGNWKVNKPDSEPLKKKGGEALFLSAKHGDKNIAELLLQHGADLNIPADNRTLPLHCAAHNGYKDIAKLFLEKGARVNERDFNNSTALIHACNHSAVEMVALLLQHGADPNIVRKSGISPLHLAAYNGYEDIAELLLKNGAKANERNVNNNTPLAFSFFCFCENKNLYGPSAKIIQLLLEHKADPNIPASNGSCPLHYAAQAGHEDMVELLLKNGAEVDKRGNGNATALAFACGYGDKSSHRPNEKVVQLLLNSGANPNIYASNESNPLHCAIRAHYKNIVELLLKNGAKVNETGSGNSNTFDLALRCLNSASKKNRSSSEQILKLICRHGTYTGSD